MNAIEVDLILKNVFPLIFQWFVMIATIFLAGMVIRAFIVSLIKPPAAASGIQPVDSMKAPNDSQEWHTEGLAKLVDNPAEPADNTALPADISAESADGFAPRADGHAEPAHSLAASAACAVEPPTRPAAPPAAPPVAPTACIRRPFGAFRRDAFWHVIILAAFSRIALYIVAYLAARVFLKTEGNFFTSLPELWQRSDAPHYIAIAENGYVNTGEDKVFLVFLPFYPLIIKLFSLVFGSALFSGILTSLITYAAACALIYETAILLGQDEDAAFLAAKYAIIFPASFFVNGAFSESLFVLLSVLFFHCLLRKKPAAAACFGLLASFTRYYGLLLVVPYAVECAQELAAARLQAARQRTEGNPSAQQTDVIQANDHQQEARGAYAAPQNPSNIMNVAETAPLGASYILRRITPIFLIPAGTGLFLLVNYIVSGNFFQFLTYQRQHWNQRFTFFFDNMHNLAANALSFEASTSASMFAPQIICIILFIIIMAYGAISGFRTSMLAYLGIYFFVSISAYWMLSFPRYIFGAAPVFSLMASLGRRSKFTDALISLICASGLIFLTIAYACGYHVY